MSWWEFRGFWGFGGFGGFCKGLIKYRVGLSDGLQILMIKRKND